MFGYSEHARHSSSSSRGLPLRCGDNARRMPQEKRPPLGGATTEKAPPLGGAKKKKGRLSAAPTKEKGPPLGGAYKRKRAASRRPFLESLDLYRLMLSDCRCTSSLRSQSAFR